MNQERHSVRNVDIGIAGNGGQYAPVMRDEPQSISLSDDDLLHNSQGSFYYPPVPRNPEQFINFWTNVEISDETLQQFEKAYNDRFREVVRPDYERAVEKYVADGVAEFDRRLAEKKAGETYQLKWKLATEEIRQSQLNLEKENRVLAKQDYQKSAPEKVPYPSWTQLDPAQLPAPIVGRSAMRPLARAGAMSAFLPSEEKWSPAAREQVLDHEIELGLNEVLSVREIEEKYKLSEIRHYLHPSTD